jgi:hypothetical protein
MIFEFSQNEFFDNTILEKQYFLNKEMLIERIESSTINWKEGKSLAHKTVKKTLKNKSIIIHIKKKLVIKRLLKFLMRKILSSISFQMLDFLQLRR